MADFHDDETLVIDGARYRTRYTRKFAHRARWQAPDPAKVTAHIPGVIVTVQVRPGQRVERGDPLLVLEAMKMKNDVVAGRAGAVKAIHVEVGQMVAKGQLLLEYD